MTDRDAAPAAASAAGAEMWAALHVVRERLPNYPAAGFASGFVEGWRAARPAPAAELKPRAENFTSDGEDGGNCNSLAPPAAEGADALEKAYGEWASSPLGYGRFTGGNDPRIPFEHGWRSALGHVAARTAPAAGAPREGGEDAALRDVVQKADRAARWCHGMVEMRARFRDLWHDLANLEMALGALDEARAAAREAARGEGQS